MADPMMSKDLEPDEGKYVAKPGEVLLCVSCFKMITGDKVRNNSFVKAGNNPPCNLCGGPMVLTNEEAVQQALNSKDS